MVTLGPVHIPWRADFAVGWGISGFSGLAAPKPWAFENSARAQLNELQDRSDAVPGNISFQQGVVSSSEDYERAIEAAASVDIKAWGVLSGQSSAKFLSNLEISSKVVHCIVVSRFETATTNVLTQQRFQPKLSPFAAELLTKIGPERWAEQFGTQFIAGYVLGGMLVGKASFVSHSDNSAQQVKADLEGNCESNIEYHCVGASMSNQQPGDIDGMLVTARHYAQNNRGGKYWAILWPFSALNSYNVAEQQYSGKRSVQLVHIGHLLRVLKLEYAKLQRLQRTLTSLRGKHASDTESAVKQVNRALRAFDRLNALVDLASVDEDSDQFDQDSYDRIFVAAQIERDLCKIGLAGYTDAKAADEFRAPPGVFTRAVMPLRAGYKH